MKIFAWIYGIMLWIKESIQSLFIPNKKTHESKFTRFMDFIVRYSLLIGIGVFALYIMTPAIEEYATLRLLTLFWSVASVFAGLSIYTFTKLDYTEALMQGEDGVYSVFERAAMVILMGIIYLANFAFTGLCIFALYLAQFAK